jgi:hypothetical protein
VQVLQVFRREARRRAHRAEHDWRAAVQTESFALVVNELSTRVRSPKSVKLSLTARPLLCSAAKAFLRASRASRSSASLARFDSISAPVKRTAEQENEWDGQLKVPTSTGLGH